MQLATSMRKNMLIQSPRA